MGNCGSKGEKKPKRGGKLDEVANLLKKKDDTGDNGPAKIEISEAKEKVEAKKIEAKTADERVPADEEDVTAEKVEVVEEKAVKQDEARVETSDAKCCENEKCCEEIKDEQYCEIKEDACCEDGVCIKEKPPTIVVETEQVKPEILETPEIEEPVDKMQMPELQNMIPPTPKEQTSAQQVLITEKIISNSNLDDPVVKGEANGCLCFA